MAAALEERTGSAWEQSHMGSIQQRRVRTTPLAFVPRCVLLRPRGTPGALAGMYDLFTGLSSINLHHVQGFSLFTHHDYLPSAVASGR